MSLTRSNTGRSQLRSPLPHVATSRPFLPPSHYAAAAGIPYDGNKHFTNTAKGNSNDPYTRAFVSAYPYDADPDSQSSFEFKPSTTVEDKPLVPPKLTRRSRRESLLNDLPQLEANLLPSLRDTIDRMTKSPSQPEPSSTSHLGIPRPSGAYRSSRSLSPSYASREKPITKSVTPEPSMGGLNSSIDVLTPRTNTPVKAPRSTLRPPAPKLRSNASDNSPPSTPRSILKKMPTHDAPPIPEGGLNRRSTVSNGPKPAIQTSRSRSRTDPGILPKTISAANQISTPTVVDGLPTPRQQPSGIPRLQSRRTGAGTWWSTDESDGDGQEKPRGRDRRQLIVPRGVSQSTSESESERQKGARVGVRRDFIGGNQLVGLGIGLGSEKKKMKGSSLRQTSTPSHTDISLRSTRRVTGDRTPVQSTSFAFDVSSEHKQRREALRDIVLNLKFDENTTETESDYDGEEGVAISGSQILTETTQTQRQAEQIVDVDSDYGHEFKEAKVSSTCRLRSRRATRAPTPSFLAPSDPDNTKARTPLLNKRHLGLPHTPTLKAQTSSQYESSRSPIISQIDAPATPAALRRHSVYHRSASPSVPTPVITNNDNENKRLSADRRSSSAGVFDKGQRGSSQQRSVNVNTTAATPTNDDREFEVITPDSIGAYKDRRDDTHPPLPHAESDLSSAGSMYWGDDSESELSPAAETLFQKLGQARGDRKASSEKALRSSVVFRTPSPSPAPIVDNSRQARSASRYEDCRPRSRLVSPPLPPPPPAPVEVTNEYTADDTELRRQDVIIEIHECEEAFVKRLQVFVQLFILPLRVQDTKEWIAGVPTEIARLFDWLEDIVVLHTQILASLASTRDAQYPTVERIAESIRAFVPRLEVYQPYLVNLEYVIGLAEELFEIEACDFTEFVRLQEKAEECEGWNFQSFLIEPVNLLARFPGLFNRLLELTPKSHRDYMPTLALVRSTEMFIRVMTEVKLREDEYDMIQQFAARIQGLPSSSHLATRERRLLHHGVLYLVDVEANDLPAASGTSALFRYFPPGMKAASSGCAKGNGNGNSNSNSNKAGLGTAVHQTLANGNGRARSGSTRSSSSTGVTLGLGSGSGSGSGSSSSVFFSSFRKAMPRGRLKRPMKMSERPASPSPAPRGGGADNVNVNVNVDLNSDSDLGMKARGTPVRVFVFSDLLVLAALGSGSCSGSESGSGKHEDEDETWTLLNHIGTTRILDVKQLLDSDTYGSY
ncbi:hypothetical protein H2248_002020 [Termitomyces sp. 'cryptogamus']|nr:hypothetical protein H2248_002020 [Termitomyces sp. 'cryptogamus']